jgi:hypothetical protein
MILEPGILPIVVPDDPGLTTSILDLHKNARTCNVNLIEGLPQEITEDAGF